jgi:threonine/homoserine/homoserine lactone efflux protein
VPVFISYLVQGAGFGLFAAAQPGSFQVFLISEALKNGWRRTLPLAFAPLLSDMPIVAAIMFLLTRLPESFLRVIRIGGGLFLLYLAWNAFRAWRGYRAEEAAVIQQDSTSFFKAATINFLNPNVYIFWMMIGGMILAQGWQESPVLPVIFLVTFYTVMISASAVIIILFGTARRLGPRLTRTLILVSAVAIGAFGFYQLWQGIMVTGG